MNKDEFTEYISYTRNLEFIQDPNYNYLYQLFKTIMQKFNYINDFKFDWTSNYLSLKSKSKK